MLPAYHSAEVAVIKAMLDLVKQETERIESRFLEPACGSGNFLAAILERNLCVVEARYGRSQLDYECYALRGGTARRADAPRGARVGQLSNRRTRRGNAPPYSPTPPAANAIDDSQPSSQ